MDRQLLARRLAATPMFSRLPAGALDDLLARSALQRVTAGAWLADAANGLQHHLVLLAGELEAHRAWIADDGRPRAAHWRVALEPDGPGFALLSASGRGIRVQALTASEFVAIDADELDAQIGWSDLGHPPTNLRHPRALQRLPLENVQRAFDRMVERVVAAGETVVSQGEPGDSYYILLAGEAEVWVQDPLTDETRRVNLLSAGDAFGEEALLLEGARTATVRMISPGRLLALGKTDFDELLKPPMLEEIDPAAAQDLLRRGAARLLDCRYETEHEESRIPGARLVPLDRLRHHGVFALEAGPTYIVYCRSGRRSKAAAVLLRERGFRALSLAGGIRDWPYEVEGAAP